MEWNAQLHMESWIHGSPDLDGGTHYESTGFQDACKMIGIGGMGSMAIWQAGEQIRYTVYLHKPR